MTDTSGQGAPWMRFGNDRESCEMWASITRQIAESTAHVVQATQAQSIAGINATNDVGRSAALLASETRSDVNRIEGSIQLAGSQSESRMTGIIERSGGDIKGAVERTAGDTRMRVDATSAELRRDIADAQSALHSTLEARSAELRQTLARDTAAIVLEIERAKTATLEARCAIERQAAENLAAIQIEALKNKCDLSKQLSECCCEVREAVRAEGNTTRMLIESNKISELQERLEVARREVEHHRHAESVRVSVQQYVNQRQYNNPAPTAVAA